MQQESLDPSDPKDRSEKQDSAVHLGNEDPADRSVERDQLAQLVHLAFLVPKATPAQRAPSDQQEQLARKVLPVQLVHQGPKGRQVSRDQLEQLARKVLLARLDPRVTQADSETLARSTTQRRRFLRPTPQPQFH